MTYSSSPDRLRLRFFALFLLLVSALVPGVALAQANQHISTRYFIISYPRGEQKAADWYAGFVDEVDISVSELLGAQPVEGLTLTIYATEADYTRANPI